MKLFLFLSTSQNIINKYADSHAMELQQRAVEYSALFTKHDNLRPGVLERMPQFERPSKQESGDDVIDQPNEAQPVTDQPVVVVVAPHENEKVFRLLGDFLF